MTDGALTLERWLLLSLVNDIAVSLVVVVAYAFVVWVLWRHR